MRRPVVFHCEQEFDHPRVKKGPRLVYFQVWCEYKDFSHVHEWVKANTKEYLVEGL
jgi:hypothetical protein